MCELGAAMRALRAGLEDRFWRFVSPEPMSGCWLWIGDSDDMISPRMSVNYMRFSAVKVACELYGTPIPPGMQANHHCDNRFCVNPAHVYAGTQLENMRDRVARGRCNAPRGERHPHAKLTAEKVAYARSRYVPRKITYRQLADELGVHPVTLAEACRGNTWMAA